MPTQESLLRTQFLEYVFGDKEGYICLATGTPKKDEKDKFSQEFFEWPRQKTEATTFIEGSRSKNVWFCVNLLDAPERTKPHCLPTNIIWADLDHCDPMILEPTPQVLIESSPNRFQALWVLDEDVPAPIAEEFSKRIYTKYREHGVDSGWALTKLLRIPFTLNFKYSSKPDVVLLRADRTSIDPSVFENMLIEELSESGVADIDLELPELSNLPAAEFIIYEYRHKLKETGFAELYNSEPDASEDWSELIWRLIRICFEAEMSREEVLVVAASSKCNKYERDKRPITHLWLDVVKADTIDKTFSTFAGDQDDVVEFPVICNEDEQALIGRTWLNDYVDWASDVTDANTEYHEIAGCILLSSMLADKLHLNVRWGKIIPNLWGLILGESTLTRKTTAMELAMEFVMEKDPQLILATQDSSAEGMLTALSQRPEKVSIYYRDEVSGFFDAMASKTYLSGMPELLAKLYDVPPIMSRQLRKETVTIEKPVFVFFGGGIQERVYDAVDYSFFYSGFLPRFLVVNGDSDIDNLQWIGPPEVKTTHINRDTLRGDLHTMVDQYRTQIVDTKIFGVEAEITQHVEIVLTNDAWEKMRQIEQLLVRTANTSSLSEVALPTFTRLSTSLLKFSMLLAASRSGPSSDFKVTVELRDIMQAAYYVQKWAPHTIHMMTNVGSSASERLIQRVLKLVRSTPGMTRSDVMRRHHLQSLEARVIFTTLEERGLITMKQAGKGHRIWAV